MSESHVARTSFGFFCGFVACLLYYLLAALIVTAAIGVIGQARLEDTGPFAIFVGLMLALFIVFSFVLGLFVIAPRVSHAVSEALDR